MSATNTRVTHPERAEKRRRRQKTEVVFDPEKRKEFLLGFEKRKRERRVKAMQEALTRAKEERATMRKEFRQSLQQRAASVSEDIDEVDEDEVAAENVRRLGATNNNAAAFETATSVTQYADDFTQQTFGSGVVTVTTTTLAETSGGGAEIIKRHDARDVDDAPPHQQRYVQVPKNVRFKTGENERLLTKLTNKFDPKTGRKKKKSSTGGGGGRRHAIGGGKKNKGGGGRRR